MKKFERFIVYPLLILTLFTSFIGGGMKTNALDFFDKIIAREIVILDENNEETVRIGSEKNELSKTISGQINIYGAYGNSKLIGSSIFLDSKNNNSSVNIFGSTPSININANKSMIQLGTAIVKNTIEDKIGFPYGITFTKNSIPLLAMGSDIEGNGLVRLYNKHGDYLVTIGANKQSGHGLIFIFDKYGEQCRPYGYGF